MILYNKPTYKCEHCRKLYQIKSACEKHEIKCKMNPDNYQPCFHCEHICKKETDVIHWGYDFSENWTKTELLYCNKKEYFIHPYWTSRPYLQEDILGEVENNYMPYECSLFEDKFDTLIPFLRREEVGNGSE